MHFLHTNKWFSWSSSVEFWTISPKPLTVNRTKHQRTCCCFLFLQRFCAFSCAFCWIWPTSGDWSPHLRRAWETKIASRIIFEYEKAEFKGCPRKLLTELCCSHTWFFKLPDFRPTFYKIPNLRHCLFDCKTFTTQTFTTPDVHHLRSSPPPV